MTLYGSVLRASLALAAAAMASTGCGGFELNSATSDSSQTSQIEQVLSESPDRPPVVDQVSDIEPNDDMASAQAVSFNETLKITGTIAGGITPLDRDVYDLGPISPGDRVLADLTVSTGTDVILGLLDENERLVGYIDQTSVAAGPSEADLVIREASNRLYVVMATRSLSGTARTYAASISVQRGAGTATARPQVLVLNFSGAPSVRIGTRAAVEVPPFDAAALGSNYADQTEAIIGTILTKVRTDFAGLNVAVYRDTDADIPSGEHSTVYFGTYDSRLLGLADDVDPYNSDTTQSAILYTDTFALFDVLSPSVEQMSQALANTTSHEAGHLLGLRHTANVADLMDTTASARQMMLDQDFGLAELNNSVLPLGFQDSPLMLAWAVGGELLPSPAGKAIMRQKFMDASGRADDFYIPRSLLMGCSCTSCIEELPVIGK